MPGPIPVRPAGERRPDITELAVVIVFEDPGIGLSRPIQQRHASPHAHGHAGLRLTPFGQVGNNVTQ
jgi:hypothetical protein